MSYTSGFTNPDGTTVKGFVPGWQVCGIALRYLGPDPLVVISPGGLTFHLVPRLGWKADERYAMDLLSREHEVYSITPSI